MNTNINGSPKPITFPELERACLARDKEWDPKGDKFGLMFFAVELGGETGEALNVIKKIVRERLNAPGSRATKEDLAGELADVVISCQNIANKEGINLGAAVRDTFNASSAKHGFTTTL